MTHVLSHMSINISFATQKLLTLILTRWESGFYIVWNGLNTIPDFLGECRNELLVLQELHIVSSGQI